MWWKKRLGKKLIVRCGYLHSQHTARKSNDERKIKQAFLLEKNAFASADRGVVSSSWQRDIVINEHHIDSSKIKVIPNYVLTDVFKQLEGTKKEYDLVFVGRGDQQKNLGNFLKAISILKTKGKNISVLMVGGCGSSDEIKEEVKRLDLEITFEGNIRNCELPLFLNKAKIFILPSLYEGHPKVLLEAMSCGMPSIGTDVLGIREEISHLKNGFLCKTDAESIASAIEFLVSNGPLCEELGRNAREHIVSHYDIEGIFEKELDVIEEVMGC